MQDIFHFFADNEEIKGREPHPNGYNNVSQYVDDHFHADYHGIFLQPPIQNEHEVPPAPTVAHKLSIFENRHKIFTITHDDLPINKEEIKLKDKSKRILKREKAKTRQQLMNPGAQSESLTGTNDDTNGPLLVSLPTSYITKKTKQKLRNRISAQNSRDKKKKLLTNMENEISTLRTENARLQARVTELEDIITRNGLSTQTQTDLTDTGSPSWNLPHENYLMQTNLYHPSSIEEESYSSNNPFFMRSGILNILGVIATVAVIGVLAISSIGGVTSPATDIKLAHQTRVLQTVEVPSNYTYPAVIANVETPPLNLYYNKYLEDVNKGLVSQIRQLQMELHKRIHECNNEPKEKKFLSKDVPKDGKYQLAPLDYFRKEANTLLCPFGVMLDPVPIFKMTGGSAYQPRDIKGVSNNQGALQNYASNVGASYHPDLDGGNKVYEDADVIIEPEEKYSEIQESSQTAMDRFQSTEWLQVFVPVGNLTYMSNENKSMKFMNSGSGSKDNIIELMCKIHSVKEISPAPSDEL